MIVVSVSPNRSQIGSLLQSVGDRREGWAVRQKRPKSDDEHDTQNAHDQRD